jgi:bifunctional DNA-binding transcriptional regulator/antitoxin component of YhaV-PrlF toxin-antitoxin module
MNRATFIREIDNLGRIVIPREYRARLDTIVDVKNDLLSRLGERV